MQRANGRSKKKEEKKKKKNTSTNKCPYAWRLTHNIQNFNIEQKQEKQTHTKRLFDEKEKDQNEREEKRSGSMD